MAIIKQGFPVITELLQCELTVVYDTHKNWYKLKPDRENPSIDRGGGKS